MATETPTEGNIFFRNYLFHVTSASCQIANEVIVVSMQRSDSVHFLRCCWWKWIQRPPRGCWHSMMNVTGKVDTRMEHKNHNCPNLWNLTLLIKPHFFRTNLTIWLFSGAVPSGGILTLHVLVSWFSSSNHSSAPFWFHPWLETAFPNLCIEISTLEGQPLHLEAVVLKSRIKQPFCNSESDNIISLLQGLVMGWTQWKVTEWAELQPR